MTTYTKDEIDEDVYAVDHADTLLIVHTDGSLLVEYDLKQMKDHDDTVVYQTNDTPRDVYRKTDGVYYDSPIKELLKHVEETFDLEIESVHFRSSTAYHHATDALQGWDIGIVDDT